MKIYSNSKDFGSISLKLLVSNGKVLKTIRNCTVVSGSHNEKKCNNCIYLQICNMLSEATKNL